MTTSSEPRAQAARVVLPWWVALPVVIVAILTAAFAGFLFGRSSARNEANAVPILGNASQYTMSHQFRKKVAFTGFRGKVQPLTFLFSDCTTMHPLVTLHQVNLGILDLRSVGLADKVDIVSFSMAPADTGSMEMRTFLSQCGWNLHESRGASLRSMPGEIRAS